MASENPVISVDTKKKEAIGDYYRDGKLYTQETVNVLDHDFPESAEVKAVPHGIYDMKQNKGYINIGISKDTGEFCCDSLKNWWDTYGNNDYPKASSILLLCDGGGSNSSRHYIFKEDLQNLVNEIGIEIRIAHYPPYTSKYNPIEHKLFPHISRAMEGMILKSVELMKSLINKAKTSTGLKVYTQIIDKIYKTGRKVTEAFKENMPIIFDEYLGKWNYTVVPLHA
jgi:hypothetical protein